MVHPVSDAKLILHVDASNFSVGAAIHHVNGNHLEPLGFYSKRLTDTQKRYSTYDRELMAIYQSIRHFKHIIEGREYTILTGHKPITFAFKQTPEKASPRQLRHLDLIGQYTRDIRHIPGKENVVADLLSRIETINCNFQINFEKLAESQKIDKELTDFMENTESILQLKLVNLPNSTKAIVCDVSTRHVRPFITKEFRKQVFHSIHGIAHPSRKATTKQITERFVWPNMKKDITEMVKTCLSCQKLKVTKHNRSAVDNFEIPENRFQWIHIDLVGP